MRLGIALLAAAIFFCTPLFVDAEQTSNKQIEIWVLFIKAPDSVLEGLGIFGDFKKMIDNNEIKVEEIRDRWENLTDACLERRNKDIDLFAYPLLHVIDGVKGGSKVSKPVQYMEKLENGNFILKTYEDRVGFEVTAKVENNGYITVDVDFRVSKMKGRLSIEGVQLDIGCPIIDSSGIKTTVKLKDGEIVSLGGISSEKRIEKTAGPTTIGYSKEIILLGACILQ